MDMFTMFLLYVAIIMACRYLYLLSEKVHNTKLQCDELKKRLDVMENGNVFEVEVK